MTGSWGIGRRFFKKVRILKHDLPHEDNLQSRWLKYKIVANIMKMV